MKDFTEEWWKALTPDDIEKNSSYILFGESKKIPPKVFEGMIKNTKFYEMEGIEELKNQWNFLTKKKTIPIRQMVWLVSLLTKIAKKTNHVKDFKRFDEMYGHLSRELWGNDLTIKNLMLRKMTTPVQVILYDVKLENFTHVKNELFGAYTFSIVDRNNRKIEGVYVYEEFANQFFSPKDYVMIDRKSKIEMARTADSGKTWIIYAMPLSTRFHDKDFNLKLRPKRVLVRNIQDGGKKQKPDMPFITIK